MPKVRCRGGPAAGALSADAGCRCRHEGRHGRGRRGDGRHGRRDGGAAGGRRRVAGVRRSRACGGSAARGAGRPRASPAGAGRGRRTATTRGASTAGAGGGPPGASSRAPARAEANETTTAPASTAALYATHAEWRRSGASFFSVEPIPTGTASATTPGCRALTLVTRRGQGCVTRRSGPPHMTSRLRSLPPCGRSASPPRPCRRGCSRTRRTRGGRRGNRGYCRCRSSRRRRCTGNRRTPARTPRALVGDALAQIRVELAEGIADRLGRVARVGRNAIADAAAERAGVRAVERGVRSSRPLRGSRVVDAALAGVAGGIAERARLPNGAELQAVGRPKRILRKLGVVQFWSTTLQ